MIKAELIYPKVIDSQGQSHIDYKNVKGRKIPELKIRFQTLILNQGMNEIEFRNKLGLSRQMWYYISWGVWDCKDSTKIKIAQALNTDSRVIWP